MRNSIRVRIWQWLLCAGICGVLLSLAGSTLWSQTPQGQQPSSYDQVTPVLLGQESFQKMMEKVKRDYPGISVVATTLRNAKTATRNDWGAVAHMGGKLHQSTIREDLEIYDRVGGGDSFASGLIYGFLSDRDRRVCRCFGDTGAARQLLPSAPPCSAGAQECRDKPAGRRHAGRDRGCCEALARFHGRSALGDDVRQHHQAVVDGLVGRLLPRLP